MATPMAGSVSYTHLDVYKRQALLQRIGMSLIDGLFCGVVIFQRGGAQVMKFRPVSYTHLDVYKRQT